MSDYIRVSVEDNVQIIRFARPEKKNALNVEMYEALIAAFETSEHNPDIRVRAIFGTEGAFTAGNDIADFISAGERGVEVIEPVLGFLHKLVFTEKPLLAAVDGLAIGIGTTMLLHCDMAFATHESAFATPFVDLGLVPEAGSSLLAPQRMGYPAAFALLVAGKALTAEGAARTHLINMVVPRDALEKHVMTIAAKLAAKPAHALALSRKLLRGDPNVVWQRIEEETAHFQECLMSGEARGAFEAFMHKPAAEAAH